MLNQFSYQKLDPNLSKAKPRLKYPVFGLELAIDPVIQATYYTGMASPNRLGEPRFHQFLIFSKVKASLGPATTAHYSWVQPISKT